ncbi:kin of IRRE-like protein 1 isoform X2 [Limulus polyphemus]|nr:kin of IRRE-like protein 1 isoform X2 [Limulus polyphemus]
MTTSGEPLTTVNEAYRPHFYEKGTPKNVTAQLGQTVYLHCVVKNLGDRTVSWIRRRDFHVLTVGKTTYTAEGRFEAVHLAHTDDWILKITLVELADCGDYECQVNTHPLMSYFVNLTVLVPQAAILGERDLLVSSGSYINLTCIIRQSPSPPMFVFWYHNDRMINYDSSRGEITLQKASEDAAMSILYIKNAKALDSGNYTCGPSNADATSVMVHVVNGEKPAAMQHDADTTSATTGFNSGFSFFFSISATLLTVFCSS